MSVKILSFLIEKVSADPEEASIATVECRLLGDRKTVHVSGQWPCSPSMMVKGLRFRGALKLQGATNCFVAVGESIAPMERDQYAALTLLSALDHGRLRPELRRLVRNMSLACANHGGAPLDRVLVGLRSPLGLDDSSELTSRRLGALERSTARSLQSAYKHLKPVVDLLAEFAMLPFDMATKLDPGDCAGLRAHPYRLCDLLACGPFDRSAVLAVADRLATSLLGLHDAPERIMQHLMLALDRVVDDTGSTWVGEESVTLAAIASLRRAWPLQDGDYAAGSVRAVLLSEAFAARVAVEAPQRSCQGRLLARKVDAELETAIAEQLAQLAGRIKFEHAYPKALALFERLLRDPKSAAPHEAAAAAGVARLCGSPSMVSAMQAILSNFLVVVYGPSGSGKSELLMTFARLVDAAKDRPLVVLTPTNGSARAFEDRCPPMRGRCHALQAPAALAPTPQGAAEGEALCIDQASMAGLHDVARIFRSRRGSRMGPVVVCGDDLQLQAVGAGGCLLRDLLRCPQIARAALPPSERATPTSGGVLAAATAMASGEAPVLRGFGRQALPADMPEIVPDQWRVISAPDKCIVDRAVDRVVELHATFRTTAQMIACTNAGCDKANARLQAALNPRASQSQKVIPRSGDGPPEWRVGDRVICKAPVHGGAERRLLVSPGEVGQIRAIYSGVTFDNVSVEFARGPLEPPLTHSFRGAAQLERALRHSWCLTAHAALGVTYGAVVCALEFPREHVSRELAYTAVTRARNSATLVCDPARMARLCARSERLDRETRLSERLCERMGRKRTRPLEVSAAQ